MKRYISQIVGLVLLTISMTANAATTDDVPFELKRSSAEPSFRADDGSMIKSMPSMGGVQSVLCTLGSGEAIQACRHKTVSQVWYVVKGTGEAWLKDTKNVESVFDLTPGTSFTVPLGYSFQFRNTGKSDLDIFIVNTTPWSGDGELIPIANHWNPHF